MKMIPHIGVGLEVINHNGRPAFEVSLNGQTVVVPLSELDDDFALRHKGQRIKGTLHSLEIDANHCDILGLGYCYESRRLFDQALELRRMANDSRLRKGDRTWKKVQDLAQYNAPSIAAMADMLHGRIPA